MFININFFYDFWGFHLGTEEQQTLRGREGEQRSRIEGWRNLERLQLNLMRFCIYVCWFVCCCCCMLYSFMCASENNYHLCEEFLLSKVEARHRVLRVCRVADCEKDQTALADRALTHTPIQMSHISYHSYLNSIIWFVYILWRLVFFPLQSPPSSSLHVIS